MVVCGHPNSAGNALKDVLEEAGLDICGLEQTLATFTRSQGRPDLLLSSQVTEGRTSVAEEHASDHFPLLATFDLAWNIRTHRTAAASATSLHRRTGTASSTRLIDPRRAISTPTPQDTHCLDPIEEGAQHLQSVLLAAAAPLPKSLREPALLERSVPNTAYQSESTDAQWTAYLEAKHARMATIMTQRRQLFDKRVSALDPARAADWNLVKSRDRGIDLPRDDH